MFGYKGCAIGAICCAILLPQALWAQNPSRTISLSESVARQLLSEKVDPVYPPIAKAARVTGDVVIAATIDPMGKVVSEKVVSGLPMLQQAALDAVKQWLFAPFKLNGAAVSVMTTLTIPFELDEQGPQPTKEQEDAAQAYFPLSDKCRNALKEQQEQDAMDFCKQALDASLKAGDLTPSDQLVSVEAHQSYGHALLLAKRAQEALDEENLAVEAAKKRLTDDEEEYAGPFYWRGIAEAGLGQQDAALGDLQIAEDTLRRAIVDLPDMKAAYSKNLSAVLKQHAAYLDALGRPADAEKLRHEAAAL
jgi:TonB family protein